MAIWTNRPNFLLPKAAAEEIQALVDHTEQLEKLLDAAERHPATVTPSEATIAVAKDAGISTDVARRLFNALENIRSLAEEFGGPEKTLDELANNVGDELATKIKEKKDKISAALTRYSKDNSVLLSYKAQRLTYLRENTFQEGEIITDARPVFDTSGDKIVEYLITHDLVATYFRQGRFENIHLAMDAADVLKLRKACDRAVVKAKALKLALGDRARILRDEDADT